MSPKRHPARRRLQQWLAGEAPRRVDRHVEECDICQAALEELSSLDAELVSDLGDAFTPPEDLTDRTTDGVHERLRDEAAFAVFLDLFAIGWDMARAMIDPDADDPSERDSSSATDRGEPHGRTSPADQDGGERP